MPAIDDGQFVKLYNGNSASVDTHEVLIGTTKTSASGERLASFVTDINGTPVVKSYVDGAGLFNGTATNTTGTVNISADDGTAASGTGITVGATSLARLAMHKITIDFTACQAAATTKDVTIWTLPAKTRVLRVVADVTATFLGGAISDCDITVGRSAGGAEYLLSFDVDTAIGTFGDTAAELGTAVQGGASFASDLVWASTTVVQMRLTSVGANLSALTQGSMTLYLEVATYP